MTPAARRRLERVVAEASGGILVVCLGLAAIAHALAGAKRSLLLDDGDSVLLPLLLRSLERGEPFRWGLSPVLFAFPEFPLYVLSAAVAGSVAGALLLNGVLNVVIFYGLLRWLAAEVRRGATARCREIVSALAGVLVFTALCLLESRPGGNTLELASLYLTTTYYSGTVMALITSMALVVRITGDGEGEDRRIRGPVAVLTVLSALAVWSNPLFVLWAAAPLSAGIVATASARHLGRPSSGPAVRPWWRRPAVTVVALLAGSGVGYLARGPLAPYLIADKTNYLRWGREDLSLGFAADAVRSMMLTPGGVVEAAAFAVLLGGTAVLAVGALRAVGRARPGRGSSGSGSSCRVSSCRESSCVVVVSAAAAVVGVPVALLVTGSISTRYALPLLFFPLSACVVLLAGLPAGLRSRIRRRYSSRLPPIGMSSSGGRRFSFKLGRRTFAGGRRTAAGLLVGVLMGGAVLAGGVSGARVLATAADPRIDGAACLTRWTDRTSTDHGRTDGAGPVSGVGQFWSVRALQAYGGDEVGLVQVNSDFTVYPWLTNLAPAEEARVGYVIVATAPDASGHVDFWGSELSALGEPRQIVRCGRFAIYDFRGTAAADTLTDIVTRSARVQAAQRGFPE